MARSKLEYCLTRVVPHGLGQAIGRVASLQAHYPGITDHVHLEVMELGGDRVNAAALITSKLVVRA